MPPRKPEKEVDSNRMLRIVVISMGLLLIGGTILVFALAFQKVNGELIEKSHVKVPREYRQCGNNEIQLGDGESLKSMEFEESVVRLIVSLPDGGTAARVVQLCTGKQLGSLTVRN